MPYALTSGGGNSYMQGVSCHGQARPASDGIDKVVADLISSEWTQDKALSLVSKRAQLVRSGAGIPR